MRNSQLRALIVRATAVIVFGGRIAIGLDAAEVRLYVSPQGNDAWSGRLVEPNPQRTDGPLASLAGARDAVRRLKTAGALTDPIRVLLRGGWYRIEEPVVFAAIDSGTPETPITYAAWPDEQPILSGGRRILGWQRRDDGLWTTTIPQVAAGQWFFRQLFVNGRRATPARSPNSGTYHPAGPLVPLGDRERARRDPGTRLGFRYREGQLQPWEGAQDALIVYYHAWTTSRHLMRTLDPGQRTVSFRNPSAWPIGWWGDDERFYVESVREALDAPGEFHLDRSTGVISYLPRPGEVLEQTEFVAPVTDCLLRLEGDPAHGSPVVNLTYDGLSFQHTSWTMPSEGTVDGQAAAFLETAAVFARDARACRFDRCEIAHTGGYGLWLENGCQGIRVEQCHLHDLGAGGVRLGQTSLPDEPSAQAERNEILNCFIHDGGHVFHAGVGVWIGRTSHNRVIHNDICDFYYSGISVGWSWGYAPSTAHHNVIEHNHIHHLGWRELSDMGGIYCLGDSPGTKLRYNLIHDVMSYPSGYGGWGLYTDEGSSGILLENNVVYRTKDGGFHQHYGRDNVVRNNVFALSCGRGQIVRTRNESHRSFVFERNIVYYREPPLLGGNWENAEGFQLDYNVYWRADGARPTFPGQRSFEQWQAQGQDEHSIVADPLFVSPEQGDFRLQPDSPAIGLGIQSIEIGSAGLTGSSTWTRLPQHVQRRPFLMPWEESE